MDKIQSEVKPARILIVEDEPDISAFLFDTLSLSDYEVMQAFDGVEGLDKIRKFKPNLVLLDIMMPKMNGLDVCRAVRKDPELRTIHIIIVTAKGSLEEKLEGFKAGASDFIAKPFSTSELLARIEAHLRMDALKLSLELSERRYRELVEYSPDGLLLFDEDTRLIFMNSQSKALLRCDDESIWLYKKLDELEKLSSLFQQIQTLISKVYETRTIVTHIVASDFPKSLSSFLEIRGIPSEIPVNSRPSVQVVLRDITEKQNMERVIARTEKINSLSILTSGIAHEINNPLTIISNIIQLLKKSSDKSEKSEEMLDMVLTNVNRITRIISDLRMFSRQERVDPGKFELVSAINDTIRLMDYQQENDQVELIVDCSNNGKYLMDGNKNQFQQLLVNLLLNSYQAITGKGTITVELLPARSPIPAITLKISDTGCGIAEDQLGKIFDPFFTTKRDWHGTGLGLPIAHRIVQLLKGDLQVSSKLNQGTVFTITLPVFKPD